jgi:hypothetical protein
MHQIRSDWTKRSPKASFMSNRSLIFLTLTLSLFSCKKQIYPLNGLEKKVNVDEIKFDYFTGKSKLKYLDGDESYNLMASIRIRYDSIIWISITPGIGVEVLRTVITPDSVFMINRLKKEFVAVSLDSLSQRLNFNVNYPMLQSILIGNLILPRKHNEKIIKDGDYYQLQQQTGDLTVNNFINSKSMKIEKLVITDDSTRNYMDVDYHNFQKIDSALFAMDNSINLFYTDKKKTINTEIILTYTKASFTDKKVRFPFNIPNRYELGEN